MGRIVGRSMFPWDKWILTLSQGKVLRLKKGKDFRAKTKVWNFANGLTVGMRRRGLEILAEVDEDGQGVTARLKKPKGGKR